MPVTVSANPTATVYDDDWPGWNAAVGGVYVTEDFTDATLNPGLSVVTEYPGYVDTLKGVWWDRLVYDVTYYPYYQNTTTWEFAVPIYAYGGTWNPGEPGGPGSNIEVEINGSWVSVGVINHNYVNVFWGFVSDVPFTKVRLSAYNIQGWCETYEMDNMVYSVLDNFVTGGGNIKDGKKVLWTFGGIVGVMPDGAMVGQFQIVDHANKVAYHTTEITALAFSGGPATTPEANNSIATFTATFRGNDGSTKTVTVTIKDLGEAAPKIDTIKLEGGLSLGETPLSGGNFQLHNIEL